VRACFLFSIVTQGILRARWIQAGRIIHGISVLGIEMNEPKRAEPWLRGTRAEVPAVQRAVLHSLQLAEEDLTRWCADLTAEQLNARPAGMASAAFHIRHIARSIDRLLTYSEGRPLTEVQMASLRAEMSPDAKPENVFAELRNALELAGNRVRALVGADLEATRIVGRRALPTTLGGLLIHVAEHTQRHVGQAITTAKVVRAARSR
jgi:uncharacterized damage-inducible protein DinB